MYYAVGVLAVVVALMSLVYLVLKLRRLQRSRAVQILQALRMLIAHLQLHRGLSSALLGGKTDVRDACSEAAASVNNDLQHLSTMDNEFTRRDEWQALTQHWARLSSMRQSLPVYDNYIQHCRLVNACLTQMGYVVQHYAIGGGRFSSGIEHWRALIEHGELLAQLRALGGLCLLVKSGDPLHHQCRRYISDQLKAMQSASVKKRWRRDLGQRVFGQCANLFELIETRVVADQAHLSFELYFQQATEVLDAVYEELDGKIQTLYSRA